MTVSTPATIQFLATHRRERSEMLADQLVEIIQTDNPGYAASGVVPRADLWLSCLDNVRRVLELLAVALDPASAEAAVGPIARDPAYAAARATGRRRAEQGLPLDDVLRSFRMGGRILWEDLLDEGRDLEPDDVRRIGSALWMVVDQTSAQVAVAYHEHLRSTLRADEQLRAELWEGVLGGRAQDHAFAVRVAQVLDLPLDGDFVVVSAVDVDPIAAEQSLAPHASAWVRRTREVVGLVALRSRDAIDAHASLRAMAVSADSVVGSSGVVHGLGEIAVGLRQAGLARASVAAPGAGFAAFDDRLPEMLLLSSPEIGERLVEIWLAPVLRLPRAEAGALLDTLTAWVASGGSASRTAELVPCHRNTVLNRLRRVSDITGRPLDEAMPPVDLVLALRGRALGLAVEPVAGHAGDALR